MLNQNFLNECVNKVINSSVDIKKLIIVEWECANTVNKIKKLQNEEKEELRYIKY